MSAEGMTTGNDRSETQCTKEVDNYVASSGTFSFCLMLWVQDLININSFSFLADVIKPNVVELVKGGMDANNVFKGLEALRRKAVSGKKLVVVMN